MEGRNYENYRIVHETNKPRKISRIEQRVGNECLGALEKKVKRAKGEYVKFYRQVVGETNWEAKLEGKRSDISRGICSIGYTNEYDPCRAFAEFVEFFRDNVINR